MKAVPFSQKEMLSFHCRCALANG